MCPKCSGFTVIERCVDMLESKHRYELVRCIICGFYDDAQMRINRRMSPGSTPIPSRARVMNRPF